MSETCHCTKCGKDFEHEGGAHVFPSCPYCNPLKYPSLRDMHSSGVAPNPFEQTECLSCSSKTLQIAALQARLAEALEDAGAQAEHMVLELASKDDLIASLRDALNRDKTGLAAALDKIRVEVSGRSWLGPEGHWASYSYEEHTVETMRKEIGWALDTIEDIARKALEASGSTAQLALRLDVKAKERT